MTDFRTTKISETENLCLKNTRHLNIQSNIFKYNLMR